MSGAFKVGDLVTYLGPSQGGILAPLDVVEVVSFNPLSDLYQLKIPHNSTYTFFAPERDLRSYQLTLYRGGDYSDFTLDSASDTGYHAKERKEAGECVRCGKKRDMSIHGLLDCKFCAPS